MITHCSAGCNAGVSASLALLAYRVAGFAGGAGYDGSWEDWGSDPPRPVAGAG